MVFTVGVLTSVPDGCGKCHPVLSCLNKQAVGHIVLTKKTNTLEMAHLGMEFGIPETNIAPANDWLEY